MSGTEKVVCVTGASGYIASWLVKLLLQRGYTVKATVRDPNNPKKTDHLLALDGAKERLKLFKANLLEEGSFDSVVDDCLWYMLSKTLAEEAAWKFAKENGIDMITMNPGLVIGPLLLSTTTFSVDTILNLINGSYSSYDGIYRFVDTRDVANAHIQAFETPSASGRYCLVGRVTPHSETLKILRELFPALFPTQE
ncbi:phenylacetaldehyde reductase-like isoform X1 [Quercus suber]|uniref:phenylacetaldehyde reductase-like isoform X1 n=1 Tax=Quercus suber TaxID=58331 RepID=UPI0032DF11F2